MAENFIPFGLNEAPETQKPPVPARTATRRRVVVDPITYGKGLLRPFRRDGAGDFNCASDISLVRSNVGQVLGTICSSAETAGEIPWRPEFGSLLHLLRYRNLDEVTLELARVHVTDAINNWVFRVRVTDTKVRADLDNYTLIIRVTYDVLGNNRRSVLASGQTSTTAVRLR